MRTILVGLGVTAALLIPVLARADEPVRRVTTYEYSDNQSSSSSRVRVNVWRPAFQSDDGTVVPGYRYSSDDSRQDLRRWGFQRTTDETFPGW